MNVHGPVAETNGEIGKRRIVEVGLVDVIVCGWCRDWRRWGRVGKWLTTRGSINGGRERRYPLRVAVGCFSHCTDLRGRGDRLSVKQLKVV